MITDRANSGRLAIIVAFVLMLALPLLQTMFHFASPRPVNENRELAPAPRWSDVLRPADFTLALQRWFQDHYGFRDLLIRLQTQLDYSVFGVSDRIHIGKNGWLYYRNVIDHEEPQIEAMTDRDLAATIASFAHLRDWLAARDIRFVVVTIQLKDRFYPEFLPITAERALGRHRFDDFRSHLHAVPGITYIDTTDTLLQLKQQRTIFHKTDFHWNDPAAFVITGQLVDAIAVAEHRPVPLWHQPLEIEQRDFSGGQANFMPLFRPPQEQALFLRLAAPDPNLQTMAVREPFEQITRMQGAAENLLGPTVVLSDSFFDGMIRAGLPDYFQSISRARIYHAPVDAVLRAIPEGTKTFILEFIEVSLPSFRDIPLPP